MVSESTGDEIFDMEAAIKVLAAKFPDIENIYIFGSRRFQTKSSRSDIDILLECKSHIKKAKLREFILEYRTALDLFVLENGRAESVANESYITAGDNKELIKKLYAELLYSRGSGSSEFLREHKEQAIDRRVQFELTTLPGSSVDYYEIRALQKLFKTAQEYGLPAVPYIGASSAEACDFLETVIRSMPQANKSVSGYGNAKDGWTIKIKCEYDFQNLFWITTKPWLPSLSREEIAIIYDGKEKRADFSLFGGQLLIEFKHIKDAEDVRETAKTLKGLAEFYGRHANVRVLLFAILVDADVDLDDKKWEAEFSSSQASQEIKTIVLRNNV